MMNNPISASIFSLVGTSIFVFVIYYLRAIKSPGWAIAAAYFMFMFFVSICIGLVSILWG